MADQLVAEEIERDAVGVATRQLAAEGPDVELLGLIEVVDRDGQVEDVAAFPHEACASKHSRVSERSPSRIVSRPRIAVEGMFPRLTSAPHPLHEVALQLRRRGFEEQALDRNVAGQDLFDEPEPELAVGPADPRATALACLEGHEECPGVDVVVDALDPAAGRQMLGPLARP